MVESQSFNVYHTTICDSQQVSPNIIVLDSNVVNLYIKGPQPGEKYVFSLYQSFTLLKLHQLECWSPYTCTTPSSEEVNVAHSKTTPVFKSTPDQESILDTIIFIRTLYIFLYTPYLFRKFLSLSYFLSLSLSIKYSLSLSL